MESEEYMNRKQQEAEVKERLVYSSSTLAIEYRMKEEGVAASGRGIMPSSKWKICPPWENRRLSRVGVAGSIHIISRPAAATVLSIIIAITTPMS